MRHQLCCLFISIYVADIIYICSFLQVNWDDVVNANQQTRLSPWEIKPTCSVLSSGSLSTTGCKRAKVTLPSVNMDFPIPSRFLICCGNLHLPKDNHTFLALFLMLVSNCLQMEISVWT